MSLSNSKALFSIKSYAAGMLALYTAFALDLDKPFWALVSVYIVSLPMADAVRSKAFYRICGSFIGAVASIILIPNFVNAPWLLSIVLSLWVSICLYISVLDRTPSSYIFLLAGYTVAIIGFPSVNAPDNIFDNSVSRFEEITIGIIYATIIHSVVFPLPVAKVIHQSMEAWWQKLKNIMRNFFAKDGNDEELIINLQDLTKQVSDIYILSKHLSFDTTNLNNKSTILSFDERLSKLLALVYITAKNFTSLRKEESSESIQLILKQMEILLLGDPNIAAEKAAHIDEEFIPDISADSSWYDIVKFNFYLNLNKLIKYYNESVELQSYLFSHAKKVPSDLDLQPNYKHRPLHHNKQAAFLSAIATFLAIMSVCTFWITSAWTFGDTAVQLTAIACCFFASQINPASFIIRFIQVVILTIPVGAFYLFAVLTRVDGFYMLMIVLAPFYLVAGFFMASPRWAFVGIAAILSLTNLILLQDKYNAEFDIYLNTAIALLSGMSVAAFMNYIFRSPNEKMHIRKLLSAIQYSLSTLAAHKKYANPSAFILLTEDRLGLLMSHLTNLTDSYAIIDQAMKYLSTGLSIIKLNHAVDSLPAKSANFIRAILNYLTTYFHYAARNKPLALSPELLKMIDYALTEITEMPKSDMRNQVLSGLCDLRRDLFPDASAYRPYDKPFAGVAIP